MSIRTLLRTLEGILGREAVAQMRWDYEKARAQGRVILPPAPPQLAAGEYQLGNVLWNTRRIYPFGLKNEELPSHIFIAGRTGAGKTNAAILLLLQLFSKRKPVLVLDWKQSYRPLLQQHDIRLLTPGSSEAPFRFNPLSLAHIPHQHREAYLRQLLSVLLNTYFRELRLLSVEGVEYLIVRALDAIRSEKESFTFQDLYTWLLNYFPSSREKDWKSSVSNVLHKITTGPIGDVFSEDKPLNISEFAKANRLVELHCLGSPKDKSFLIQVLLLQLYYYFSQQPPTSSMRYFILLEEAHNVLLRHQDGYETVTELVLRQIREYGVALCLLDQHPSMMSLPALGTATAIAFNLRTSEDIRVMAGSLGLGQDADFLSVLQVGQAVVKLSTRWQKPFAIQLPQVSLQPESEARKLPWNMALLPRIEAVLARTQPKPRDFQPTSGIPRKSQIAPGIPESVPRDLPSTAGISTDFHDQEPPRQSSTTTSSRDYQSSSGFHEEIRQRSRKSEPHKGDILRFLLDVHNYAPSPTITRYKRLRLHPRDGNEIRSAAVRDGLIKPVVISAGRARITLFQFTGMGKMKLREAGIDPSARKRKGSLEHQYWCHQALEYYERHNYGVLMEVPVGSGKTVDLVAMKGKEKVAVEVETGKSDYISNIRKCQTEGFTKVVVFGTTTKATAKIQQAVAKHGLTDGNLVVASVSQLLR